MPLSIEDLIEKIGVPLHELVEELEKLAATNPDLLPVIQQLQALLLAEVTHEKLTAKVAQVAQELVELFQKGSGPVTTDDTDLA